MSTPHFSAACIASLSLLLVFSAVCPDCSADNVFFDADVSDDFNTAANWSDDTLPSADIDFHFIENGLTATFSGGTTAVRGLRVGNASFGRLRMTGGTLDVQDVNVLVVGRERFPLPVGGDYNENGVVDAADYAVWRDTVGSDSDFRADSDQNGVIEQADYDFWRANFGSRVKGGEIIMTGDSTITSNGVLIGERTIGRLSIGPNAVVSSRIFEAGIVGGAEDIRVGGYGPAYDDLGSEPGLDGDGLVDVQGTLNAKDLYVSEHGAIGEIRLSGGTVNLSGSLIMSFCNADGTVGGCVSDPDRLALQSSKVSIIGSSGTLNVGLDPDPAIVDPMPPNRDILSNYPSTATFSFTADAGGVTPITVVDNDAELSGNANIDGTKLELNLDAYTSASPLTLIDAPPGHLSGTFGTVTFLGNTTATVNYDATNGNVFLNNFQRLAVASSPVGSAVPEPASWTLLGIALAVIRRRR